MRKHGKFREKGTNFVTGNLEELNRCSRRDTGALFGTTEDGRKERKGQRRMGSAREDELGKVRYKPEELGLYIDDRRRAVDGAENDPNAGRILRKSWLFSR